MRNYFDANTLPVSAVPPRIHSAGAEMMEGHVAGMLDRDQRTAKIRLTNHEHYCAKKCASSATSPSSTYGRICDKFSQYENCFKTNCRHRNHHHHHKHTKHFWKSVQKFQQVLIVGVYLTLVTTIPSTALSAPTGLMEESTPKPPRWHNPCGKSEHYGAPISTNGLYQPKLDSLIVAVKKAIFDLNRMKSNLSLTMNFGGDFNHTSKFYDFRTDQEKCHPIKVTELSIPYGQGIKPDDFDQHNFENVTLESYMYLQTIAATFAAIHRKMEDLPVDITNYAAHFDRIENILISVLCELRDQMRDLTSITNVNIEDVWIEESKEYAMSKAKPCIVIFFRRLLYGMEYIDNWAEHFNQTNDGQ